MKRPKTKKFLIALDEFLACFDPAELIRAGINRVKFNYDHPGEKYSETFTLTQLEKERKKACNS